jgi:ribosomal protein S18 acetylase RimI-like enzyme
MLDRSKRLRGERGGGDPGRWQPRRRITGDPAGADPGAGPDAADDLAARQGPARRSEWSPSVASEVLTPLRSALRAEVADLVLRPATMEDIPGLRALVIADTDAALGPTVPSAVRALMGSLQMEARRPAIAPTLPDTLDAVLLRGDALIGRLVLRRTPVGARLLDIALMPMARRQGLGGAVLRALGGAADDLGWTVAARVWFESPAQSLFRRAGYIKVGGTAVDHLLERRPAGPVGEPRATAKG